ncbi:hypothetical protein MYCTH_2127975 [Thermothelomyces thermophilus ATCC 42464]|uniref:Uncharacterized protein n=1 Tax=Thermothelomyces thermophilus (strain ATCC 42464 / BCRC 31852 / DSM 1799) TaxID=573729 RepID=G2QHR2_THET4|nr:uncharacterized protein MYCTH_2127975 [Thermothelomyces thermophilus ATCC 42464]AEO58922.1 hypothetical protein MYCTH_2127975 [Thermothelomyces thermophilus ATCC 42464]
MRRARNEIAVGGLKLAADLATDQHLGALSTEFDGAYPPYLSPSSRTTTNLPAFDPSSNLTMFHALLYQRAAS